MLCDNCVCCLHIIVLSMQKRLKSLKIKHTWDLSMEDGLPASVASVQDKFTAYHCIVGCDVVQLSPTYVGRNVFSYVCQGCYISFEHLDRETSFWHVTMSSWYWSKAGLPRSSASIQGYRNNFFSTALLFLTAFYYMTYKWSQGQIFITILLAKWTIVTSQWAPDKKAF